MDESFMTAHDLNHKNRLSVALSRLHMLEESQLSTDRPTSHAANSLRTLIVKAYASQRRWHQDMSANMWGHYRRLNCLCRGVLYNAVNWRMTQSFARHLCHRLRRNKETECRGLHINVLAGMSEVLSRFRVESCIASFSLSTC